MNGQVVLGFVSDFDDQSVSIVHFQSWAWELPIHRYRIMGSAQPLHWGCLNLHYHSSKHFLSKSLIYTHNKLIILQEYIYTNVQQTRAHELWRLLKPIRE